MRVLPGVGVAARFFSVEGFQNWTFALRVLGDMRRDVSRLAAGDATEAIPDDDRAIRIGKALRTELEPRGAWRPDRRNVLSHVDVNRGNARDAISHRFGAIPDYDEGVRFRQPRWSGLEPRAESPEV